MDKIDNIIEQIETKVKSAQLLRVHADAIWSIF